jgi:hypothetical protein
MRFDRKYRIEHVPLEKLPWAFTGKVSGPILEQLGAVHRDHPLRMAQFYEELDPFFNDMLFTVSGFLLGLKDEKKTVPTTVPATWWDHLKHDFLQSGVQWKVWLAQCFDAPQYEAISQEYTETRICPHNNTYFPEDKSHIDFLVGRSDDRT